ncbi:MAG: transposase [Nocardioides sp.]|nr:transposase [Nocardioides sp.]
MTMTAADVATDDGGMGPRADRPKRRTFTADYKARILAEYDTAEHGVRGAVLCREGLYSSHIIEWRKAAQAGAAAGLEPATRNRRERELDREIEQLRARAEQAEAELARSRAALDLMGKAHALLETLSESAVPPVIAKRSKK